MDDALYTITAPRPTRISVQRVRIWFSCRFPMFIPATSSPPPGTPRRAPRSCGTYRSSSKPGRTPRRRLPARTPRPPGPPRPGSRPAGGAPTPRVPAYFPLVPPAAERSAVRQPGEGRKAFPDGVGRDPHSAGRPDRGHGVLHVLEPPDPEERRFVPLLYGGSTVYHDA